MNLRRIKNALACRYRAYRHYTQAKRTLAQHPDVFLLCNTPAHGNLGDQAIIEGEHAFLRDYFPNKQIIDVWHSDLLYGMRWFKQLGAASTVLIHGGGNLGTLWMEEERVIRNVLQQFPAKNFVIFPQTIYFGPSEEEQTELAQSQAIYQAKRNVTVCCRERASFDFMQKTFPGVQSELIPDMVLYLQELADEARALPEKTDSRHGILLCLRPDKERVFSDEDESQLISLLHKQLPNEEISRTSTIIPGDISPEKRKDAILAKIGEIGQANLFVTDRLHGMVFAALAGTPCVALDNSSKKVGGVYEWLQSLEYVTFAETPNGIEGAITRVLKTADTPEGRRFNNAALQPYYEHLAEIIAGK